MNFSIPRFLLFLLTACISFSCNPERKPVSAGLLLENQFRKTEELTEAELKGWYYKDIIADTIPGISLEKAYDIIGEKALQPVTVAVIDTEIDIYHEDLKNTFWKNSGEIPDNNRDDDQNGYVDDVNGWNFIGNAQGENIIYANIPSIRVIRYYQDQFQEVTDPELLSAGDRADYRVYERALRNYDSLRKVALDDQKYGNFLVDTYPRSKALLKEFFPKGEYTIEQLDSLYALFKDQEESAKLIYYMADYMKYGLTQEFINNYKEGADKKLETTYNLEYDDREILGDDPHDLEDTDYGNNQVAGNLEEMYHGTLVAGLIAAERNNGIGINGIAPNVKIMPVCISSNGSENDKDIALAIRYAVDNGARIINMSFGKDFSLHTDWVLEAIEYAAASDVLIVSSAGNSSIDLNRENSYFPNDNLLNGREVSDNFVLVGSTSHSLDENFRSWFSNYGQIDVDLFAPGEQIYTTSTRDRYQFDSGTSLSSAITTGVAALVWSYEPTLSAREVKEILLNSGVSYDLEVKIPEDRCAPFPALSRSGKVVNAYNALLLTK